MMEIIHNKSQEINNVNYTDSYNMLMRKKLLIPIICFFISGCKKNTEETKVYSYDLFAFGISYGFCIKECATFFALIDGKLYPDNVSRYKKDSIEFKAESLPHEKYLIAQKLIEEIPAYLRNNPNQVIGCPDCLDQGVVSLLTKKDGILQYWDIDPFVENQPMEIRSYVKNVTDIIKQLE